MKDRVLRSFGARVEDEDLKGPVDPRAGMSE